jgi:hypothetical protein
MPYLYLPFRVFCRNKITVLLFFGLAGALAANAQTYTINYASMGAGACPANVFANAYTVSNYSHLTTQGYPVFVSGDNALALPCNSTGSLGTEYQVSFPFKKNADYTITVHAGVSGGTSPNMYLRINNASNGNNASCAGSGGSQIQAPTDHYKSLISTSGSTYTDYAWQVNNIDNDYSYLLVSAFPTANSGNVAIEIKTITIVQVLHTVTNPDFVLSPSSLSLQCGDQSARTFTVSNPNNVAGTLGYTWNVGNGWLYNGSVPGGAFAAGNSITLTPINSAATPPTNVGVAVSVNGAAYKSYTATMTQTNPAPSLSIAAANGGAPVCSSSPQSFTVNGVPTASSVVTWSTSPAGIASPSSPANPTSLSYLSDGLVSLSATVSNTCGSWPASYNGQITVGAPPAPTEIHEFQPGVSFPANSNATFTINPGPGTVNWTVVGGTIIGGQGGVEIGVIVDNSPGSMIQVTVNRQNACGTSGSFFAEAPITDCPSCPPPVRAAPKLSSQKDSTLFISSGPSQPTLYPNPASSTLHVYLPGTDLANTFIRIYDLNSRLLSESIPHATDMPIDISRLAKGVYIIKIYDGQKSITKKFIKQ